MKTTKVKDSCLCKKIGSFFLIYYNSFYQLPHRIYQVWKVIIILNRIYIEINVKCCSNQLHYCQDCIDQSVSCIILYIALPTHPFFISFILYLGKCQGFELCCLCVLFMASCDIPNKHTHTAAPLYNDFPSSIFFPSQTHPEVSTCRCKQATRTERERQVHSHTQKQLHFHTHLNKHINLKTKQKRKETHTDLYVIG